MKFKKNYNFFIAILLVSFSFFKAQTASDFFISDAKNEREVLVNCNYPLVNGNYVALSANHIETFSSSKVPASLPQNWSAAIWYMSVLKSFSVIAETKGFL